jgi:2-polyprenyl-3-methyl-5-hydroxy-6-metoxy-1,4-benzoquinol methylase
LDIVEVIRSYPALDWKKTISQAEAMGARRMLFLGLHLAERLLDLELPLEVSRRIRKESKINALASRIEEQLFLESRQILGRETHTFSWSMRERLRDKLRYSGYRVLHWFSWVTTPTEKDRDRLPQSMSLSRLAYLIRPVRLLSEGLLKIFKPSTQEFVSTTGLAQDASLTRTKTHQKNDGATDDGANLKLISTEPDLDRQVAFYDQRWSDFTYANRLKLERCRSILSALAATRLFEPRIVDLGCGAGWLAGIVGNFGPTTGVDLSHQAVAEAAVKYPYVNFIQADILNWKYPKGSFDLVVSQEIIEHVKDQKGYIKVAHGLLREGGYLVLTTPNARIMQAMPEQARTAWSNQPIEDWLTISELKSLLKGRFEIVSLTTIILNLGSGGLYRVVNSERLRGALARLGLLGVFNFLRSSLGFGLHIVIVGKKIPTAFPNKLKP